MFQYVVATTLFLDVWVAVVVDDAVKLAHVLFHG